MRVNFVTVIAIGVFVSLVTIFVVTHTNRSAGSALARQETAFEHVARTRVLRCAYISWSASYFMKDPNTGKFQGVGYDLAEALAANMNLKIEWIEEVGVGTMYAGLASGRYDAICTPVWQDASGGTQGLFTSAAYFSPTYAYARADDARFSAGDPLVLAKLNTPDITIVDVEGSNGTVIHQNRYPLAKTLFLPGLTPAADIIGNVLAGKADITQQNPAFLEDFLKANPGALKRVTPALMVFPTSLVVVPLTEQPLVNWLDLGIASLVESGTVDQILDRYDPTRALFLRVAKPYIETSLPP